jgi:hypothetical protein
MRDVALFHYPVCTDWIKPHLQFCYFALTNASEGSPFFPDFTTQSDLKYRYMIVPMCFKVWIGLKKAVFSSNFKIVYSIHVYIITSKTESVFQYFVFFSLVFRRSTRNIVEDYGYLATQFIQAVAMSVVVGFVYFNLGLDQSSVRDRFGMMYIIGALYPYMVVLDLIGLCKFINR